MTRTVNLVIDHVRSFNKIFHQHEGPRLNYLYPRSRPLDSIEAQWNIMLSRSGTGGYSVIQRFEKRAKETAPYLVTTNLMHALLRLSILRKVYGHAAPSSRSIFFLKANKVPWFWQLIFILKSPSRIFYPDSVTSVYQSIFPRRTNVANRDVSVRQCIRARI